MQIRPLRFAVPMLPASWAGGVRLLPARTVLGYGLSGLLAIPMPCHPPSGRSDRSSGEGTDPPSVLARLVASGSDLEARCARRLRDEALLIDLERLVGHAARIVVRLSQEPSADALPDGISMAIHLVLDEDRELALAGEQGDADAYEFLRRVFFVSEGDGPRAASEFNAQPFPVRRDTLNLIVRGLSMQECRDLAAGDGAEAVIARARRGMLTLLGVEEDEFLRRARRRLRSEERR